MHATEVVELRVTSAVLVSQRVLVGNGDDCGNGLIVLESHADLECLAEAVHQVGEPRLGLRRHMEPFPSQNEKTVKVIEQLLRRAFRVGKAFALAAANLTLD